MERAAAAAMSLSAVSAVAGQLATLEYIGAGDHGDLNEAGQIAIRYRDGSSYSLARYTDGIGIESINMPIPGQVAGFPRINGAGQIAFTWNSGGNLQAYRFTGGIGVQALNSVGVSYSDANAINDSGHVVGAAQGWGGASAAYRYTDSTGMTHITEPGPLHMEYAAAINNGGQIAGTTGWPNYRALRFDPGVGVIPLGTLGGGASVAGGMNSLGDVIGWSEASDGIEYNFLYTDGGGLQALGTMALTMIHRDINDQRWIVGEDANNSRAFIWTSELGYMDLNSLLAPGLQGRLYRATSINNQGQIVAWGNINGQGGLFRVTVLQLPGPGGIVLLAMGLLTYRRRR